MSGTKSVVPGRARIGLKKVGLWVPAKLLKRLYHLADIKCRTKTAELIAAVEGHLEREELR
jgi:predicted transcriptional regulator